MSSETMSEALDVIHHKALQLLTLVHSTEARELTEAIISIAQHKYDTKETAKVAEGESGEERLRREMMESGDPDVWMPIS
jgi:hypothetical protein